MTRTPCMQHVRTMVARKLPGTSDHCGIDGYMVSAAPKSAGKKSTVADLLIFEAALWRLPKLFMSDLLVHDLAWIEGKGSGKAFAWYLYDGGTYLVIPATISRLHSLRNNDFLKAIQDTVPGGRWYVCEGTPETLAACDFQTAQDFVSGQVEKGSAQ